MQEEKTGHCPVSSCCSYDCYAADEHPPKGRQTAGGVMSGGVARSKNLNRTQWKPLITAQPRTRQPDGTSNRNRFRSDPDSTFGKTTRRRNILLHFITKFNTQKKAPLTSLRSRFVCFCFQPCVSGHAKEEGECPTRRLKTLVCL